MTPIKLRLMNRLYVELNESISRAVALYDKLYRLSGITSAPLIQGGDISEIYEEHVRVKYEHYRRNCLVDSGYCSIPIRYLDDATYEASIIETIEKQLDAQNLKLRQQAESVIQAKRAQLAQLKAELGEE